MSEGKNATDFGEFLTTLITLQTDVLMPGRTTLFVFRDCDHIREWLGFTRDISDDVRVAVLSSELMPQLTVDSTLDRNRVAIAGVCIGINADYSDLNCLHYNAFSFENDKIIFQ